MHSRGLSTCRGLENCWKASKSYWISGKANQYSINSGEAHCPKRWACQNSRSGTNCGEGCRGGSPLNHQRESSSSAREIYRSTNRSGKACSCGGKSDWTLRRHAGHLKSSWKVGWNSKSYIYRSNCGKIGWEDSGRGVRNHFASAHQNQLNYRKSCLEDSAYLL